MLASSENQPRPAVSIIMPTYNRAGFLPQAFASIRAQTWTDWELIIVDDGSTDNTQEILPELCGTVTQSVRCLRQENKGPAPARNTGLDNAQGKYIAFFDSDDIWLPHHVRNCVEAMEANPDVDWVYGACRTVDHASGQEMVSNTFYVEGKPRPFLKLEGRREGNLFVIDDPDTVHCMLGHGSYCGLQNSVIRRRVFAAYRLPPMFAGEDGVAVICSLKAGFHFGYFDNIHVIYHVHGENSSASSQNGSVEKNLRIQRAIVGGLEELRTQVSFTPAESRVLKQGLGGILFWRIGYSILWQNGRRSEAMKYFRQGIKYCPTNWRFWKTYIIAGFRNLVQRQKDMTCL